MTHIFVSELTIIGSDNNLSPDRRQAIIRTNAGILLIRTLGTQFQWNLNLNSYIFIQENAFENVWKMASILSQPQCVNTCTSSATPYKYMQLLWLCLQMAYHLSHCWLTLRSYTYITMLYGYYIAIALLNSLRGTDDVTQNGGRDLAKSELLCSDVSYWLGAILESILSMFRFLVAGDAGKPPHHRRLGVIRTYPMGWRQPTRRHLGYRVCYRYGHLRRGARLLR